MTEEKRYEIYKTSLVINSLQAITLYGMFCYIFTKYITFLQTLQEPILLFIGSLFFIYISLGKVINEIGNIFNNNKYHIHLNNKKKTKKSIDN